MDRRPTDEERDILSDVYALITLGWCQGAQARDADGRSVEPAAQDAVAWCLIGAINCILDQRRHTQLYDRIRFLVNEAAYDRSGVNAQMFNDLSTTTQDAALTVIRDAMR